MTKLISGAPRNFAALGLALAALAAPPPSAKAESWSITLPADASIRIARPQAVPLHDGGYLLHGEAQDSSYTLRTGAPGRSYTLRFDVEGQMTGTPQHLLRGYSYHFLDSESGLIVHEPRAYEYNDYDAAVDDPFLGMFCQRSQDFSGLDARWFAMDFWIEPQHVEAPGARRFAVIPRGDDEYWISHFDADCARQDVALLASERPVTLHQARADRAIALRIPARGSDAPPARLLAVADAGVEWEIDLVDTASGLIPRIEASLDGGAFSYVREAGGLSRYAADGTLTWRVSTLAHASGWFEHEGQIVLYGRSASGSGTTVLSHAADGALQSTRTLPDSIYFQRLPALQGALVIREQANDDPTKPYPPAQSVLRLRPDGSWGTLLERSRGLAPMALLKSGRLLVQPAGDPSTIQQYDPESDSVTAAPPAETPALRRTSLMHLDGDSVFLLFGDAELAHLAADGNQRWRVPLPEPAAGFDFSEFLIASNAERVCLRHLKSEVGVLCLRRSDGGRIYGWSPALSYRRGDRLELDADNQLRTVSLNCPVATGLCHPQIVRVQRFRADGSPMAALELTPPPGSGGYNQFLNGPDRFLISNASSDTATELKVMNSLGQTLWQRTEPGKDLRGLAFDDTGRVLLVDGPFEVRSIELHDAQGRLLWRQPLGAAFPFGSPTKAVALANGDWLVLERAELGATPLSATRSLVSRRTATSGAPIWSAWIRSAGFDPDIQLAEDAGLAILTEASTAPARSLAIDLASGQVVSALRIGHREPGSNGFGEELDDFTRASIKVRPDGSAVTSVLQLGSGELRVRAQPADVWQAPSPPLPAIAARGIWHAEDSAGQGLFLDVDTATDQVFGGWFTYGVEGGHVIAEQRWYTLLGAATAENGDIEFAIYRNAGGRFVTGPPTASEIVGTAKLRLRDCDSAVLSYRFDGERTFEAQGAIPLQRSAGAGCGAAPTISATGAWYQPERSGQGLFFLPTADTAAGNQFAAAWFTYDPADASDDPESHSWFTLLGEIGNDGRGTLTIYRTVGGAFDRGHTDNSRAVGSVEVTLDGCAAMRLEYAFDEELGAFSGRQGALDLLRIGGCGGATR